MLSSEHIRRSRVWFSSSSSKVPEFPTAPKSRNITAIPAAYMDTTGFALPAAKRSITSIPTGAVKRPTGEAANSSGERARTDRICRRARSASICPEVCRIMAETTWVATGSEESARSSRLTGPPPAIVTDAVQPSGTTRARGSAPSSTSSFASSTVVKIWGPSPLSAGE